MISCDIFTVHQGGIVTGYGLGYPGGRTLYSDGMGPGASNYSSTSRHAGAGHGGCGGTYYSGQVGGDAYGDFRRPDLPGSGASESNGNGGSALHIVASAVEINGTLDFSGSNSSGSGSGGSIWIETQFFMGNGTILARGGTPQYPNPYGGAGGGGRIAISHSNNSFHGIISTAGGGSRDFGEWKNGAPGTIYFVREGFDKLFVTNEGNSHEAWGGVISDEDLSTWQFGEIELREFGSLRFLDPSDTVSFEDTTLVGEGNISIFGFVNLTNCTVLNVFCLELEDTSFSIFGNHTLLHSTSLSVKGKIGQLGHFHISGESLVHLYPSGMTSPEQQGHYRFPGDLSLSLNSSLYLHSQVGTFDNGSYGITLYAHSLEISEGSLISASGMGYFSETRFGRGPGGVDEDSGTPSCHCTPGAGHAGFGGRGGRYDISGGGSYGNFQQPTDLGSCPGGNNGGNGGGAIKLIVEDTLTLNGHIDVSGSDGRYYEGGGSGGSLWIVASQLTGSGGISANGGNSRWLKDWRIGFPFGGGGAAGRVAIYLNTPLQPFIGFIDAIGGIGQLEDGAPGTVYVSESNRERLMVANKFRSGLPADIISPIPTSWNFSQISLTQNGDLRFVNPEDIVMLDSRQIVGDNSSKLCVEGTLDASMLNEIFGFGICSLTGGTVIVNESTTLLGVSSVIQGFLHGAKDFRVQAEASLYLSGNGSTSNGFAGQYNFVNLSVSNSSKLILAPDQIRNTSVIIDCLNFRLDEGSMVDSKGHGFGTSNAAYSGGYYQNDGAPHAGQGGDARGQISTRSPYGSAFEPTSLGSGCGYYQCGGNGGGAMKFQVQETMMIDGEINAEGTNGNNGSNFNHIPCGSGSGGSIWLDVNILKGSGVITVNGGNTEDKYNGGGGGSAGRIAIYSHQYLFTGNITAVGGSGFSSKFGAPGTVYFFHKSNSSSILLVDNHHRVGSSKDATIAFSETDHIGLISLRNNASLHFLASVSTVTIFPEMLKTDHTGCQICTSGTLNLTEFGHIDQVSFCAKEGGILVLNPSLIIDGVNISSNGTLVGAENLSVTNFGSVNLNAAGKSFRHSRSQYRFDRLSLRDGASLFSFPDLYSNSTQGIQLNVGELFVGENSKIISFGYPTNQGDGSPPIEQYSRTTSGGAHGGEGGPCRRLRPRCSGGCPYLDYPGGVAYGNSLYPITLGSGGGGSTYATSGRYNSVFGFSGGGSLVVNAGRWLEIHGEVLCDGEGTDESYSQGGGAGGSIILSCLTDDIGLVGNSTAIISASGGNANSGAGAGAGGRIAIINCSLSHFRGLIRAAGGVNPSDEVNNGGPGTIFTNNAEGTSISVDNLGNATKVPAVIFEEAEGAYQFDSINIFGNGFLQFNSTLRITDKTQMSGDKSGKICSTKLIDAKDKSTFKSFGLCSLGGGHLSLSNSSSVTLSGVHFDIQGTITKGLDIIIEDGGTFQLWEFGYSCQCRAGMFEFNRLLLRHGETLPRKGGILRVIGAVTLKINRDFSVSSLSVVDGMGTGYNRLDGPGGGTSYYSCNSGGGHGGEGGGCSSAQGGTTYGNNSFPVMKGSGGGIYPVEKLVRNLGGEGGGALVFVTALFHLDGKITVNGAAGKTPNNTAQYSAGGSGGSIFFISSECTGYGSLTAIGGNGSHFDHASGGGGGRISFHCSDDWHYDLRVLGGYGQESGQNGTACYLSDFPIVPFSMSCTESSTLLNSSGRCDFCSCPSPSLSSFSGDGFPSNLSTRAHSLSSSGYVPFTSQSSFLQDPSTEESGQANVIYWALGVLLFFIGTIFISAGIVLSFKTFKSPSKSHAKVPDFDMETYPSKPIEQEGETDDLPPQPKKGTELTPLSTDHRTSPKHTSSQECNSKEISDGNEAGPSPHAGVMKSKLAREETSPPTQPSEPDLRKEVTQASRSFPQKITTPIANKNMIPFDDLDFEEKIGSGQFGFVHRGRWRGGLVAIKMLNSLTLTEKERLEFLAEGALMGNLRPGPNVVQFFGVTRKPLSIVMEFMNKGSLYSLIFKDKELLSETTKFRLASEIAAGMLHITKENVVHSDLACRNVLLSDSLTAKISDFGMSRFGPNKGDASKSMQSGVGPLKWMSPESLSQNIYNEKTDVWSFGITLYELLTEMAPYHGINPVQVATKVSLPKSKPVFFRDLVSHCLQFKPEDRPTFSDLHSSFIKLDSNSTTHHQVDTTEVVFAKYGGIPTMEEVEKDRKYGGIPSHQEVENEEGYAGIPTIEEVEEKDRKYGGIPSHQEVENEEGYAGIPTIEELKQRES